jgi:hypothetical protein
MSQLMAFLLQRWRQLRARSPWTRIISCVHIVLTVFEPHSYADVIFRIFKLWNCQLAHVIFGVIVMEMG